MTTEIEPMLARMLEAAVDGANGVGEVLEAGGDWAPMLLLCNDDALTIVALPNELRTILGLKRLLLHEDDATIELVDQLLKIAGQRQHQPLAAIIALLARPLEALKGNTHRVLEAGGQQTVLVRKVVVERGFGHAQARRDLVQGRRMITLEIE